MLVKKKSNLIRNIILQLYKSGTQSNNYESIKRLIHNYYVRKSP